MPEDLFAVRPRSEIELAQEEPLREDSQRLYLPSLETKAVSNLADDTQGERWRLSNLCRLLVIFHRANYNCL